MDSDLIPPSFVAPPFDLSHPFAVWQAFAVRAVLPGLAFNLSLAGLAVGLSRWVDVPLTLISIAGLATFGGLLKGLNDSLQDARDYSDVVIEAYQFNLISYRTYIQNLQINQIRAGRGSVVNVSQNSGTSETLETSVQTTYEAHETYKLAVDLLAMSLQAQKHLEDGARITKPVAFDAVNAAYERRGEVGIGHERWQAAMQLLGDAQVMRNPLKPAWGRDSLRVGTVKDGCQLLDRLMIERGYWKVNGMWMHQ